MQSNNNKFISNLLRANSRKVGLQIVIVFSEEVLVLAPTK